MLTLELQEPNIVLSHLTSQYPPKWCVLHFFDLMTGVQVVYNANKLSKLVSEKKKKQNWLDYYQLKYTRNQSKKPTIKVKHNFNKMKNFKMWIYYDTSGRIYIISILTSHC